MIGDDTKPKRKAKRVTPLKETTVVSPDDEEQHDNNNQEQPYGTYNGIVE